MTHMGQRTQARPHVRSILTLPLLFDHFPIEKTSMSNAPHRLITATAKATWTETLIRVLFGVKIIALS